MNQQTNIEDDPYVYPGTSILRNLADIRDEERLERFESDTVLHGSLSFTETPFVRNS